MSFQVPTQGLVTNVPPHLVGNSALIDGSNVFVDLDGVLKTRRGVLSVGSQLSPAERVMGITPYEDNNGIYFPVVGTTRRWQALEAGVWTDLSGGTLLNGTVTDPSRFTTFSNNGKIWVIGANNVDQLHEWNSTLAAYQPLNSAFPSRDVISVANRVVILNTVESGTRYPYRVRWSAVNDQTTWDSGNVNDLADNACSIVGAALTSRTSAVIYRQFDAWYMQAVPGGDNNAFAFDIIPAADNMTGPISPASIVVAEGSQFYFGYDGRIYTFNGTSVAPFSDPVDPVLRSLYNNATPGQFHSCYVPAFRQLCFFFTQNSQVGPQSCITFDLRRQAFEPIWNFPYVITSSAAVRLAIGPNWTNWVDPGTTWLEVPYASWDSIPAGNQPSAFVGDSTGNVYYFGVSNQDNGVVIPYFASWGLQRAADELSNALVHYVEFYQPQSLTDDTIIATLLGYLQPLSSGSQVQTITSLTIVTDDQTTFTQTLTPGPTGSQNLKSNLIQLVMNASGSFGQFAFSGATLLIDIDFRNDPRAGVNQ